LKLLESARAEHDQSWAARRSHILDHLLARFGEVFTDQVLMHYSPEGLNTTEELVECKRRFFAEVPSLAYHRYQAHDIFDAEQVWDTPMYPVLRNVLDGCWASLHPIAAISPMSSASSTRRRTRTPSQKFAFASLIPRTRKPSSPARGTTKTRMTPLPRMRIAIRLGMSAANYRFRDGN
jgi:hypothetical protein